MFKSLRSRLILASVLWTAGLLFLMHFSSFLLQHRVPMPRGHDAISPVLAAVALMICGFVAARRSLAPVIRLGDKVLAVRQGKAKQIDGKYPSEVQPLIDSLNRLIADRERSIRRSQAVAGDLAHSLKTPLTILAREVDAARAAGNRELGDSLAAQIERMSSQIEYQLARARTVASAPLGSTRCDVTACAESLLRTLARLHAARQLEITTAIPSGAAVRVLREDLEEILGNVLDNACKWARRRVSLAAAPDGEFLELVVEDDGPGLPQNVRTAVLRRGVRLDESSPGAGLGLSIVCDLVEQYEGTMWIGDSSLGGAAVCVRLPAG